MTFPDRPPHYGPKRFPWQKDYDQAKVLQPDGNTANFTAHGPATDWHLAFLEDPQGLVIFQGDRDGAESRGLRESEVPVDSVTHVTLPTLPTVAPHETLHGFSRVTHGHHEAGFYVTPTDDPGRVLRWLVLRYPDSRHYAKPKEARADARAGRF